MDVRNETQIIEITFLCTLYHESYRGSNTRVKFRMNVADPKIETRQMMTITLITLFVIHGTK